MVPNPTEAKTRKELIDPALQKAGWDVHNSEQVGLEIPVDGFDPKAWQALEARLKRISAENGIASMELPKGVSDYALYRANGEIDLGEMELPIKAEQLRMVIFAPQPASLVSQWIGVDIV